MSYGYYYNRWYRERGFRERQLRRMVRQLNKGVPPNRIGGDRDILQAAMETVQRQCDVADDIGGTR